MSSCVSCGADLPTGQRVCSMCYGDPHYGNDGYYAAWIHEQEDADREEEWRRRLDEEPDPPR